MNFKRYLKLPETTGSAIFTWRKHLLYRAQSMLQYLGPPGVLGIGLIAFCTMIWGTAILNQSTERKAIEEALHAITTPVVDPQRTVRQQTELAAFYAALPNKSQLAILVGQLHTHAETVGIRFTHTDFHVAEPDKDAVAAVPAVIVTLDMNANHEQTVQFVNRVLAELPNAALEAIALKRNKLADTTLETQLRFRFFVRAS